jgi:hypothetical protein
MIKGDKVYCIDNSNKSILKLNKIYTIYKVYHDEVIYIKLENTSNRYHASRFITFDEHRRNKVLKLKETICLKRVIK